MDFQSVRYIALTHIYNFAGISNVPDNIDAVCRYAAQIYIIKRTPLSISALDPIYLRVPSSGR
jgi:hypothetical protein